MDFISIAALTTVFAVFVWVVLIYNGILSKHQAVKRAWADVVAQERQKQKVLPDLEIIAEKSERFESDLHVRITKLRAALDGLSPREYNPKQLAEVESEARAVRSALQVTVENYPDLKTTSLYKRFMVEVSDQQERVTAAIRIFNQNVESFNVGLVVIPNVFVNQMLLKKSPVTPFEDTAASGGFEYRPSVD